MDRLASYSMSLLRIEFTREVITVKLLAAKGLLPCKEIDAEKTFTPAASYKMKH